MYHYLLKFYTKINRIIILIIFWQELSNYSVPLGFPGGSVIILGSKITADGDCNDEIKRCLVLVRKVMTNLDRILNSRDITLPTKVCLVKAMIFPVLMWELDYKESWAAKNWSFWTEVLERTLENPMDCKEIQPVHPKGNQSWIFIGRTEAEVETPSVWPPDAKNGLMWKYLDARKDWKQEEKKTI